MLTPVSSRPDVPAGYQVKPADEGLGLLDWSWAHERLRGRYIWWLATVRPSGRPHLMPVWAVWLDDGVAFSTGADSRKAKNLAANPNVSIVPERGVESVIVEGVVATLPDERMDDFIKAYVEWFDFDPSGMNEPVFMVQPTTVFGFIDADEKFTSTATRWSFEH